MCLLNNLQDDIVISIFSEWINFESIYNTIISFPQIEIRKRFMIILKLPIFNNIPLYINHITYTNKIKSVETLISNFDLSTELYMKEFGNYIQGLQITRCIDLTLEQSNILISLLPNLKTLIICKPNIDFSFLNKVKKLTTFSIAYGNITLTDELLISVFTKSPNLTDITLHHLNDITDLSMECLFTSCKNIINLNLSKCKLLTEKTIKYIGTTNGTITNLTLSGFNSENSSILEPLSKISSNITELNLYGIYDTSDTFINIIKQMKNIICFTSNCFSLEQYDNFLDESVIKNCENARINDTSILCKYKNLHDIHKIFVHNIDIILNTHFNLRIFKLYMHVIKKFDINIFISFLRKNIHLNCIQICDDIPFDILIILLKECPKLISLEFQYCIVTKEILDFINIIFPKLEKISISNCTLEEDNLCLFIERSKYLRSIYFSNIPMSYKTYNTIATNSKFLVKISIYGERYFNFYGNPNIMEIKNYKEIIDSLKNILDKCTRLYFVTFPFEEMKSYMNGNFI